MATNSSTRRAAERAEKRASEAAASAGAPANPLALGQCVIRAQDAGIILSTDPSHSMFTRIGFSTTGSQPPTVVIQRVGSPVPTGALHEVIHSAVLDDPATSRQKVALLRRSGTGGMSLDLLASSESGTDVVRTSASLATSAATVVVGLAPDGIGAPSSDVLLAGVDGGKVYVYAVDPATGATTTSWSLSMAGVTAVLAARLVRGRTVPQLMMVVAASNGHLLALAIPSDGLAKGAASLTPAQLDLGAYLATAPVSVAPASVTATGPQQLAVSYLSTDATPVGHVAVVAVGSDGALTRVSDIAIDSAFKNATREGTTQRLVAADFNDDGLDELVVAYPATYGGTFGAAAFVLLSGATGTLVASSTYAIANTDQQPYASVDLHVAAGIFGDGVTRGVLALGAGSSFQDIVHGRVEVIAGLVTVDPATLEFPPLGAQPAIAASATTLATFPANLLGFLGFAADFSGYSVVLGPPTFETASAATQILAILEAPPYDVAAMKTPPTLTFTKSGSDVNGYNVSSNQMWTSSTDVGVTIGVGPASFTRHMSNTYGRQFDKTTDTTTSKSVQITDSISNNDALLVYAMDYWVWKYPVYKTAASESPSGTMLVVFPATTAPVQQLITPYENASYGYRRIYENGCLASYIGLEMDGYDPTDTKQHLFDPIGLSVSDDTGDALVTYDQTNMNQETTNTGYTVHNTTSNAGHLAASTTLFDYLPANFGLNVSETDSYSDTEITTTTLSHTEQFSVSVSAGTVNDSAFAYEMTPYVYQHATLGCLVVSYQVRVIGVGAGWPRALAQPTPMLVRPFRRSTKDPVLSAFSRSITFEVDAKTGAVTINVLIFNKSVNQATGVQCELYTGAPVADENGNLAPAPDATLIGRGSGTIDGLQRITISVPFPDAKEGTTVTAKVWGGVVPEMFAEIGWNIYPPSDFASYGSLAKLLNQP